MGLQSTKKDRRIASVIALFLASFILAIVIQIYRDETRILADHSKQTAYQELTVARDRLQNKLALDLQYAEIFEILLRDEPGSLNEKSFASFAAQIYRKQKSIISIALAPEGIQKYIYPLETDFLYRNQDVLAGGASSKRFEEAMMSHTSFAEGPVHTSEGGLVIQNYRPIYLGEGDETTDWGIATLVVDFATLLEEVGLEEERNKYYYALKSWGDSGKEPFIWGREDLFHKDSIILPVEFSTLKWELAIYPVGGWAYTKGFIDKALAVAIFAILALSVFFYESIVLIRMRRRQAIFDPLTGVTSRGEFFRLFDELKQMPDQKKRGLLIIDLDEFKRINDTYGHRTGDQVLIAISERVMERIRQEDVLARYGGDEFLLLIRRIDDEQTLQMIADRILQSINQPISIDHNVFAISASMGGVIFGADNVDLDVLIGIADRRLYDAKEAGKSRCLI